MKLLTILLEDCMQQTTHLYTLKQPSYCCSDAFVLTAADMLFPGYVHEV